jgi:hypothetical protein
MNAAHPIALTTPDGSGQAVHPDVIRLDAPFCGFQYWMAYTPYPFGDERLENPCVRASTDGLIWEAMPGCPDPMFAAPEGAKDHHADTELIFRNGRLVMLFMTTTVGEASATISYTETCDVVAWSDPKAICQDDWIVSPCVVAADNNGVCTLWYVQCHADAPKPVSTLFRRVGADLDMLGDAQPCTLAIPGHILWHIDIIAAGSGFEALVTAFPIGLNPSRSRLFHAVSTDGITFTLSSASPIVSPSLFGWDDRMVYRSTFIREGRDYRIWYSAASWSMRCGIGYLEGNLRTLRTNAAAATSARVALLTRLKEDGIGLVKYLILQYAPPEIVRGLRRIAGR